MTNAAGDARELGSCLALGPPPRAKTSTILMHPPQQGHGRSSLKGSSAGGVSCGGGAAAAPWRSPLPGCRWPGSLRDGCGEVHQEAADKFRRGERHGFIAARAFDAVILDGKGDALCIGGDQALVGNGDAMGAAGKIGEHRFRSAKRRLSILPIITETGSRSATLTIRCI